MMDINEVLDNLCLYDTRHPDYSWLHDDGDEPIPKDKCVCDNCFYDRHKMAVYILELLGESTTNDEH